jgi:hypothetical protein
LTVGHMDNKPSIEQRMERVEKSLQSLQLHD